MKLTCEKVEEIFKDCFFGNGEEQINPIIVKGITCTVGFNPLKIDKNKNTIKELLNELPDDFHGNKGGGMSFLQACVDRTGRQWGEHINIEQLLLLGLASGLIQYCLERELWNIFPGGMPYFVIKQPDTLGRVE